MGKVEILMMGDSVHPGTFISCTALVEANDIDEFLNEVGLECGCDWQRVGYKGFWFENEEAIKELEQEFPGLAFEERKD